MSKRMETVFKLGDYPHAECPKCKLLHVDFDGLAMQEHAKRIEIADRLDSSTALLAEIVAWFDVLHSKIDGERDNFSIGMRHVWPIDWMIRAKESVVEKHTHNYRRSDLIPGELVCACGHYVRESE